MMQDERPSDQTVISIEHLWAGYDHHIVLEDVNLRVQELDFVGIIGPNGGGKTTLLRVILGLLPPVRGQVQIMGTPVSQGRHWVGYVPQTVELDRDFPISVWEVARMGRLGKRGLLKRYTAEDNELVAESLRRMEMLDLRDRPIGALSGGQRQRAYIARALAAEPKILLLDEPTASVDPEMSHSIYELLGELNKRVTILMISHDMAAISAHVKTVGCLNRRLFYEGEREFTPDMIDGAYHCPIDLVAHGIPHRVFPFYEGQESPR